LVTDNVQYIHPVLVRRDKGTKEVAAGDLTYQYHDNPQGNLEDYVNKGIPAGRLHNIQNISEKIEEMVCSQNKSLPQHKLDETVLCRYEVKRNFNYLYRGI